jgi:SAM-dependent methyltransferase
MVTASSLVESVDQNTRAVGKAHEIGFWREFMQSDRCRFGWCDATPNPECDQEIYTLLRYVASSFGQSGRTVDVLDIGSGPISVLTNVFHGLQANLKAADPLADDYEKLWTDHARRLRAVRPMGVAGEDLVDYFGSNAFDVTHIRNAIDHAVNPIAVVEQLIEITRKNGLVIIHGFENEADSERWGGFHQWNMRIIRGDLEFEGAAHKKFRVIANFSNQLRLISACTKRLVNGKNWSTLVVQVA